MKRLFFSLVLLGAPMFGASSNINLDVLSGRPVVNGVYINNQGPYRFLLDSGVTTNQLEAGIAAKLGLNPTFKVKLVVSYTEPSGVVDTYQEIKQSITLLANVNHEVIYTTIDGAVAPSAAILDEQSAGYSVRVDIDSIAVGASSVKVTALERS